MNMKSIENYTERVDANRKIEWQNGSESCLSLLLRIAKVAKTPFFIALLHGKQPANNLSRATHHSFIHCPIGLPIL